MYHKQYWIPNHLRGDEAEFDISNECCSNVCENSWLNIGVWYVKHQNVWDGSRDEAYLYEGDDGEMSDSD